jgi:Uri superfamily endonuclease
LPRPVSLPPRRFAGELAAGHYVYFGNAWGPGGIRARCARHFRRAKKRHWHVDWLTDFAERPMAAAFPGMDECDLVGRALALAGVSVPIPGFGSSDCRRCPAHLLALDAGCLAVLSDGLYQ